MLIRHPLLEIRPVETADTPAVLEVYRQCEDFLALGPQPRASLSMVTQDIETSNREGGIYCVIQAVAGELAGVVDFVPAGFSKEPSHAFLSLLMIGSPYRRHGLGSLVVELVEAEIGRDPGITAIYLGVQVNNPQALRFWRRAGYRIVGGPTEQVDQTVAWLLCKDVAGRESEGGGFSRPAGAQASEL